MSMKAWSSGKIKKIDKEKKLGIIGEDFGEDVIFSLDDLILPESEVSPTEKVQVGQTVFFQKVAGKFGEEAKEIAILDEAKMKMS